MKRNGDQGGAASSKTRNECKAPSTWGTYFKAITAIFRIRCADVPPRFFRAIVGISWFTIGILLVGMQVFFTPPLMMPFPFNWILGIIGFFVILPLGVIHYWHSLGGDC